MGRASKHHRSLFWITVIALIASSGCISLTAIPASRLPPSLLAAPRAGKEPINLIGLRQDPPPVYQLGPDDVLGVYIEGVLGQADQPPPVHFPEANPLSGSGGLPPSIGYPMPIREDGTISMPLLPGPIRLSGLTLTQAEDEIRNEYIREGILLPEKNRVIITLMRKRTYQVLVVREDTSAGGGAGATGLGDLSSGGAGQIRRGSARAIDLKAYENDVLHALTETGGLPGLDAKNEIKILRGAFNDAQGRQALMQDFDEGMFPPGVSPDNPNIIRIPLRRLPNDPPIKIDEEDIILTDGDILFIESREREVYYTGGMLQGREHLLPRDYDLDVLAAISVAGSAVGTGTSGGFSGGGSNGFSGGGGGGLNARGLLPPTDLIVVRKTKGGYQIPIRVRLQTALKNPAERILIQPGDLIILQYTPVELVGNILLNSISINYFLNKLQ
ncbi:MAG TPA: polysaccharide biosynthesis/export family protein [Pirellulales bacterium]|jgi:hypothetical protein|nr:polysaccharide biosynthesis/export family protein [Pirellulales bacterium]